MTRNIKTAIFISGINYWSEVLFAKLHTKMSSHGTNLETKRESEYWIKKKKNIGTNLCTKKKTYF